MVMVRNHKNQPIIMVHDNPSLLAAFYRSRTLNFYLYPSSRPRLSNEYAFHCPEFLTVGGGQVCLEVPESTSYIICICTHGARRACPGTPDTENGNIFVSPLLNMLEGWFWYQNVEKINTNNFFSYTEEK